MPKISVNEIEIDYRLEGDGPETIVLINGLGDDKESWAFQTEDLLNAGFRVLRFDNRGIGQSSKPPGPYTTKLLADDAKALIDALEIADFHLLGVSMGGMISQEYAIAHGSDLRSLILVCTYAEPGLFCLRLFKLWEDMARADGVIFSMRDVLLWCFTSSFYEEQPELAREFDEGLEALQMTTESYLGQIHAIQHHRTTDRLAKITVPTLVLAGESDVLIPVPQSRRLHAGIGGAAWASSRGGHAFMWEYPAEFNRAVLDFLAQHRQG